MTILATREEPRFLVSDLELRRKGPSYTYDTVRALYRRLHRLYDLYFIIGGDSAEALSTWYRIRETMRYCTFVAVGRPGYAAHHDEVSRYLAGKGLKKFVWVDAEEMDISSTDIRKRLYDGKPVDQFVPKAVVEYIRQRDLYRR